MATSFSEFLNRNTIKPSAELPMVHTTAAYFLKKIRAGDAIMPQDCEVFGGKLSYFFFARPAYKIKGDGNQVSEWELPACFIFDYHVIPKPKRVFPFDSGAFRSGKVPNYIGMMPVEEFDVANVPNAASRIVGAYFADVRSYFDSHAKGTTDFQAEFSPGVFDAEVKAVHRLAIADGTSKLDDRKITVEIQTEEMIDLRVKKPLAVVAPLPYMHNVEFRDHVLKLWKADLITYPVSPLSSEAYYGLIYERVEALYKSWGVL
jgi:hypothetical protein